MLTFFRSNAKIRRTVSGGHHDILRRHHFVFGLSGHIFPVFQIRFFHARSRLGEINGGALRASCRMLSPAGRLRF